MQAMPQSWKLAATGSGAADKAAVKAAIETNAGSAFPSKLPIGGRMLKFRDDASDAAGIALWGAKQKHASLSYAASLSISAGASNEKRAETSSRKRPAL